MAQKRLRFYLGGADLEMHAIRLLVVETLGTGSVEDKGLRWGAKASAYGAEIEASLARGETPVLVELKDDLSAGLSRGRLLVVDHHDDRAGADKPSSLRQVFDALQLPADRWTRHMSLVEANDIGHIRALRALGATPEEISAIRAADRRAQGITEDIEAASRSAIAGMQQLPGLAVIETKLSTASAITDFLEPELGGPGVENLLVIMPAKLAFYGDGSIIAKLKTIPGCWYGGALPARGFWGVESSGPDKDALAARIAELAVGASTRTL